MSEGPFPTAPDPVLPTPHVEAPPFAWDDDALETPSRLHTGLEILKDNFEAFTVALIMALVIKHFCVEAFKIPTGSMYPTLYGENTSPQDIGDRILVDKWAYLGSGPERWDVVVFRYPLNWSKHFIKRVVGLGGEWIKTGYGDIWTRTSDEDPWRIATKRRRVRDELYLPVYPPEPDDYDERPPPVASKYWEVDEGGGWTVEDHQTLRFAGGEKASALLQKRIGRKTSPSSHSMSGDGDLVRDVRIVLALTPEKEGAFTLSWRAAEDHAAVVRLAFPGMEDGSRASTWRADGEHLMVPLDARLAAGRTTHLELECVDGQVYVHVDGEEVAHLDENRSIDDLRDIQDYMQELTLKAEGGAVVVRDLRIERDVHYRAKEMYELSRGGTGVQVPEGHYFMLGDNTDSSSDSRAWKLAGVVLEDGSEIWYEANSNDNSPRTDDDGYLRVIDQEGVERRWQREDEDHRPPYRAVPFVDRDLIVGRAFYIFWPIFPDFPGRAGFIH